MDTGANVSVQTDASDAPASASTGGAPATLAQLAPSTADQSAAGSVATPRGTPTGGAVTAEQSLRTARANAGDAQGPGADAAAAAASAAFNTPTTVWPAADRTW